MDFSQLQERLRLELLRRIERGSLSVSLLARQTGLGQPHVSNFLHGRRGMSLKTLDKMLAAQHLEIADLLPARRESLGEMLEEQIEKVQHVALVGHQTAIFEPYIRASSVQAMLPLPGRWLKELETRCPAGRRQWVRFVAVRIAAEEARAMEPVLQAECVVVLDRHYTSFSAYREGEANLYGARLGTDGGTGTGSRLVVRYAQFEAERVVLRAHRALWHADVLEPGRGEVATDCLVGRVVLVLVRYGVGKRGTRKAGMGLGTEELETLTRD